MTAFAITLIRIIAAISVGAYSARMMTDDEYERRALELQDRIATMTDQELVAEYQKTDGTAGDPYVDALAAALEERDVDL